MTTMTALAAQLVRRDAIDPSPTNPRKRFDEVSLRELASTMTPDVGIIEPLVVRLSKKAGRYELVAGERRWRAAAIAQLEEVPVVVRSLTDEQVIEIQIIENEKRKDIHALEQSDAFVAWIKLNPRLTPKLLAERIGMSERFVQNLLHYQKLAPAVREAFYDNKITAGHADLIVRLATEVQGKALEACFARDYDAERELQAGNSNLFADERASTAGKQSTIVRTVSVRELDDWIKRSIRLDVTPGADETRFFPEIREALTAKPIPGAESVKGSPVILQVADVYHYQPAKGEKEPFPLASQDWNEVKGKKCEFTQRAVVVLGSRRGRLLDVCTARGKCKAHWEWTIEKPASPAAKKAAHVKPAKKSAAQLRHEKAQSQSKLWDKVRPAAVKLATEKVSTLKAGAVAFGLIGDALREYMWQVKIPKNPTLLDLLTAVVEHDAADDFTFGDTAKRLGLNLKPLFAAAAVKVVPAKKGISDPKDLKSVRKQIDKRHAKKPKRKAGAKK